MITLPREPWRGGQICGYQEEYGVVPGRSVFCGEYKVPGLYFCQHHHDWVAMDGPIRMAPGNAVGLEIRWGGFHYIVHRNGKMIAFCASRGVLEKKYGFTLSWEPWEGNTPDDPTTEELADFYAQLNGKHRDTYTVHPAPEGG